MESFDKRAAARASGQDDLLSYKYERGIQGNSHNVAVRLDRLQWQLPHPGVYLTQTGKPSWLQRARAAQMYLGEKAAADARTGAFLYGLDVDQPETLEFTMSQADRPAPEGVHVYRSRRPVKRTRWVDGVRVAPVERVLLGLAAVLRGEELERAVESALLKRLTTEERIYMTLVEEGGRGVKGSKALWQLMHLRPKGRPARSVFEIRTGHALRAGGLAHFDRNYPVMVDGELFEIDKAFVQEMVAVESDGAAFHSTRTQRERNRRKQRKLEAAGWRFRRVEYAETLTSEGRDQLVTDVRTLLTASEAPERG